MCGPCFVILSAVRSLYHQVRFPLRHSIFVPLRSFLKAPHLFVVCCPFSHFPPLSLLVAERGFRVGVVERGPLLGREQEWNISEAELEEMVEAEVLSQEVQYHTAHVQTVVPQQTRFAASGYPPVGRK